MPVLNSQVHNANTLGASLLARTYSHTHNQAYRELAQKALRYTAHYQRSDGSWYYGGYPNCHWVDNFHTGYVLDCFKRYVESTGEDPYGSDGWRV
jgi:rhamnogalacturonyl hydrolase YesR